MRRINLIIIHCSASDNPLHDNIEEIRRWHKARGWRDIGYHYFIDKRGIVHKGRKESHVGAHCKGKNQRSIGICLSGEHDFQEAQFEAARKLCKRLCIDYKIDKLDIQPHNAFSNKTCPNFSVLKNISSKMV